jgi:glycosyltransferase involved in cell wall biosynthesis
MKKTAILVSPAPVDGYPPVQYQARILADAGLAVELVTQPLPEAKAVKFQHPGVRISALAPIPRGLPRPLHRLRILAQMLGFVLAVTFARLRGGANAVEIAFDPDGILVADHALFRPRRRIAHLHETVQRMGASPMETRLPKALARYSRVVVADHGRAEVLRDQMGMPALPHVTPNYPLKDDRPFDPVEPSPGFEVIYGGSISRNHMIDLVIRSVPLWPKEARLTLLGDDTKPQALELKALAASLGVADRVNFLGWVDLDRVLDRYRRAHLAIALLSTAQTQLMLSVGASNKRYQYMQAGLAQIGDLVLGVPELLRDNGVGRSISEYSEAAIADIVAYYLNHPEERIEAGKRARQLHLERYNYQLVFEPTLRWILDHKGAAV